VDSVTKAVHSSESARVRGEQVAPVDEDGEGEALCDGMTQEGAYGGPRRGEAFDE